VEDISPPGFFASSRPAIQRINAVGFRQVETALEITIADACCCCNEGVGLRRPEAVRGRQSKAAQQRRTPKGITKDFCDFLKQLPLFARI